MELTKEQHDAFVNWALRYLKTRESINPKIDTSYIRRAFIEAYKYGFYLSNDDVKKL